MWARDKKSHEEERELQMMASGIEETGRRRRSSGEGSMGKALEDALGTCDGHAASLLQLTAQYVCAGPWLKWIEFKGYEAD